MVRVAAVTSMVAVIVVAAMRVVAIVATVRLVVAVVGPLAVAALVLPVRLLVGPGVAHRPNLRRRNELATTDTEENAIAAPAIVGDRNPSAATGIASTL